MDNDTYPDSFVSLLSTTSILSCSKKTDQTVRRKHTLSWSQPRNSVAVHHQNSEKYSDEPRITVAVYYQNAERYADEPRNTVAVHYQNAEMNHETL